MTPDMDDRGLRAYVLGASSDAESDAIERAYFDDSGVLDRLRAAEDDLIDDYLAGRLDAAARERFERHYLATPGHRTRVKVVRALGRVPFARAHVPAETAGGARRWMAIAAGVLLIVSAAWLIRSRSGETPSTAGAPAATSAPVFAVAPPPATSAPADRPSPPPQAPSRGAPPAIVATVTLSPILVRSAAEPPSLTIPPAAEFVVLRLRDAGGERRLEHGRAVIRTVTGREVWSGPAVPQPGAAGARARVDVPASSLPADDYIVELRAAARGGRDVERHRYFLRVRR